ncbi:MAG: homocysteine S-methyltransferase family protein [Candidatus Metalachnospira sp.]|nr:homocysteine S-methyltransferase family protein [Candidatus Metalachnospira sp.]
MNVLECIRKEIFYLDGGTGSYLQERGLRPGELPETWNIIKPEEIVALHRAYYEAGSNSVCTNTFGANGLKYNGKDGQFTVSEVVKAAVKCAKEARETVVGGQKNRFIALDIGPLGRLLAPLGDVSFERAVELFAEVVRSGAEAGADYVYIETMNDCYETKAAVLAAKENCTLPVFVSNVYDESGKLMSGASPESMVAMLEGLGADVIGLNCSLGPEKMLEILPRFIACTSVPVLVKPNAGLPHSDEGRTVYDVTAEDFAAVMRSIVEGGATVVGGCCGTTPAYIKALVEATAGLTPISIVQKNISVISSYTHAVKFGGEPILIGERINPTGKKRFKEALSSHDIGYILKEGISQQEAGVHVLDVNVGLPEIDEPSMLEDCVKELQGVCDLPLQLDTSNPKAMERAMRIYNGKPMINSVNGGKTSMDAVFPLVKKYGGLVVCLTLDETGIPETAEGRFEIAERIVRHAAEYGIKPCDLIFDPLAMTVSSDNSAALVTLKTIPMIRERLGACCSLGVSNISFGLPNRDFITASFFTMALARGLDAAIMNPYSAEMMKAYHCFLALSGQDANCRKYIGFAQNVTVDSLIKPTLQNQSDSREGLQGAIIRGLCDEASRLAYEALVTIEPLTLINEQIVPALDIVGRGFEDKTIFLPQLLMSAEAAKAAFEQAKKKMPITEEIGPAVILATVKGDIHDIGKNIVKALLENYGYHVIDLGRDVAPETIAEAAVRNNVKLVGLSALMTTTVPAMADTIELLKKEKPDCQVVVGGAVLTQDYADKIGASHYAKNAMETVRYAEKVLK